jgi:Family of unknown function (DUF5662)
MPSAYITDLIDHKERVSKYMRVASDEILGHRLDYSLPSTSYIDGKSTLMQLVEYVGYVSSCHPLQDALDKVKLGGQLGQIAEKTLLYFRESRFDWINVVISDLFHRAAVHDNSKFSHEEFELYGLAFPVLQLYAYGTPKFQETLDDIKPAVEHHYQVNDHHVEHFSNGIAGMHAIQQIEMCCD